MTGNNLEQQEFRQAVDQTVERLQRLAEQINAQGVPTEFDHKSGHPGEQICQLAKGWNADLIVVGRRGHKGLTEFLTGSTSNHVLHHAPCSVLIVQGTETVQEIETA